MWVRTRRVVGWAIGHLKVDEAFSLILNPTLAPEIALCAVVLHNICERCSCPFEESWLPTNPNPMALQPMQEGNDPDLVEDERIRNHLAEYVHTHHH